MSLSVQTSLQTVTTTPPASVGISDPLASTVRSVKNVKIDPLPAFDGSFAAKQTFVNLTEPDELLKAFRSEKKAQQMILFFDQVISLRKEGEFESLHESFDQLELDDDTKPYVWLAAKNIIQNTMDNPKRKSPVTERERSLLAFLESKIDFMPAFDGSQAAKQAFVELTASDEILEAFPTYLKAQLTILFFDEVIALKTEGEFESLQESMDQLELDDATKAHVWLAAKNLMTNTIPKSSMTEREQNLLGLLDRKGAEAKQVKQRMSTKMKVVLGLTMLSGASLIGMTVYNRFFAGISSQPEVNPPLDPQPVFQPPAVFGIRRNTYSDPTQCVSCIITWLD